MGKRKTLTCHKTQNLKWKRRRLWSVCVCQRKRGNCTVGQKLKNIFDTKKSLCNKIFCCYSHKNMYKIYLTFSSLYKDNIIILCHLSRNVSLVINFMWKFVLQLHTVSHVRVYFPNAWIIFLPYRQTLIFSDSCSPFFVVWLFIHSKIALKKY